MGGDRDVCDIFYLLNTFKRAMPKKWAEMPGYPGSARPGKAFKRATPKKWAEKNSKELSDYPKVPISARPERPSSERRH
jgi:hypothetical protein